jgi:hypothetical protein
LAQVAHRLGLLVDWLDQHDPDATQFEPGGPHATLRQGFDRHCVNVEKILVSQNRGIKVRNQKIDVVDAFKHDYNSADP